MISRDELVQGLVDLHELDQRMNFEKGAQIHKIYQNDQNLKQTLHSTQEVLGCSYAWAAFLFNLYDVFGFDYFYPDVATSVYRTCLATDKPIYWLEMAAQEEWTNKQLSAAIAKAQGKPVDPEDAGAKPIAKVKGKIKLHPDGHKLLIESDKDIKVADDFEQGMDGYVRIEH